MAPTPGSVAARGPRVVAGYRIIRQLGAGGMGTVFEAHEEKMNRRVALKVLARSLADAARAEERFAREAWIAGKLNHPNLVKVFEKGEFEDLSFFSMELVDGGSLGDVLKSLRAWGKDDSLGLVFGTRAYVSWAIEQIVQAARGLEHAHRQGVVHRDIKPMNILLNRDPPAVKVADFGLALDLAATRMTVTGTAMGTISYMAPEQIRGRKDLMDARTDVYALGVTLFELLTLQLPYAGETQQMYVNEVLTAAARKPHKLNERVGRDLEVVIGKALEKNPKDRYPSAGALADDLENVLHFRPISARPPSAAQRLTQWIRRRPMHAALAGVLIVAVPSLGVLGGRALQHRRLVSQLQVEAWKEQADRLLHDDRFREAQEPLDRILESDPGDIDALRDRSLSLARLAQTETAPPVRADLERRALQDATRVIGLLPGAAWPHRVRGFLLTSFGRPEEAAPDEEAAATLRKGERDYYEYHIDGRLAFFAFDDAAAVEAFGEVIRLRPDLADARLWRARAYEDLGETARAMTDYEVATALKPSDVISRVNLGRLRTMAGAYEEGAELFRQVLALEPSNAVAHEGMSANLLARGREATAAEDSGQASAWFSEAEDEARAALAADPSLEWARVNLGASLMEQNRLQPSPALAQEAIEQYEKTIAERRSRTTDPRDEILVTALVNQCDALIQTERLTEALKSCTDVVTANPDDATAHYNLAAVHALSGRPDEALAALRKDVELGDRDWEYLETDPWFASLRSDARFRDLVERMRQATGG